MITLHRYQEPILEAHQPSLATGTHTRTRNESGDQDFQILAQTKTASGVGREAPDSDDALNAGRIFPSNNDFNHN